MPNAAKVHRASWEYLRDRYRRQQQRTYDAKRLSAAKRGYDRRWRRFRLWYLRRHPLCQWPGCNLPATQVDHVVSLEGGGLHCDEGNSRGFCATHHSIKTCNENGGFGRPKVGGAVIFLPMADS